MIEALIFDKDGTLYEFHATFADWAVTVLHEFAPHDPELRNRLAGAIRFDLEARTFHGDSPVIAGTNKEVAELLAAVLPDQSVSVLERRLIDASAQAPLAEAAELGPVLDDLRQRGLGLGVMTNDGEEAARIQLARSGVADRFGVILGADSGHGGKPAPKPLLAACAVLDVAPARAAMVGDSTHDLIAGRRAGMYTIAVLTGMAGAETLSPHADVILPDIAHIAPWLDGLL